MRVVMDVHRERGHYVGTLTRVSDRLSFPFWGLLELVYALERVEEAEALEAPRTPPPTDGTDPN